MELAPKESYLFSEDYRTGFKSSKIQKSLKKQRENRKTFCRIVRIQRSYFFSHSF